MENRLLTDFIKVSKFGVNKYKKEIILWVERNGIIDVKISHKECAKQPEDILYMVNCYNVFPEERLREMQLLYFKKIWINIRNRGTRSRQTP